MIIINGRIFPMESEPIECGYVRTCGKKILDLGPMSQYKEEDIDNEILDVSGAWMIV